MENKSFNLSFSSEEKNEIKEISKEGEDMIINPKEKFKRKNRKKFSNKKKFIEQELKEAFDPKMMKKIRAADKNVDPFRDSERTHVSEINSVNEFFFSDSDNPKDLLSIYIDNDYSFPSIFKFSEDFQSLYSIGNLSEFRKIRSKSAIIRSNYSFNSKYNFIF